MSVSDGKDTGQPVTLSQEQFRSLLKEAQKTSNAATRIGQLLAGVVMLAMGLLILFGFGAIFL